MERQRQQKRRQQQENSSYWRMQIDERLVQEAQQRDSAMVKNPHDQWNIETRERVE